ncbi:hypothetical protein EUX58_21735 [Pseudomonas sp. 770NI]|nr:hypothetical protein EUX58_21735 [Pseudomonas sp. 770NI]
MIRSKKCGSWLACDAGTSVIQLHRGDAIAGKPAPTLGWVVLRSYSASRCIGVITRPSFSACPSCASMKYTRSSSNWPLSTR